MRSFAGGFVPATILALALAAPAGAQENLDQGKTGAQLYAANCALCHKSAQALNKSAGLFGLQGFLREHYTASKESAGLIATYLESVGSPPAKRTGAKRTAKGDDKAKAGEEKKTKAKTDENKENKAEKPEKSEKLDKNAKPEKPEAKRSEPKTGAKTDEKTGQKSDVEPADEDSKAKEKPKAAKDKNKPGSAASAKPDKKDKSGD